MNIDSLVNTYGVFLLILIYVVVNVAYKNMLNLIIFIVVILATLGIFENKINAVILAYVISILYGIVKNFHLLENFNTIKTSKNDNKVNKVKSVKESESNHEQEQESSVELNISESANLIKDIDEKTRNVPDMDVLISTKLVEKFVKNLKEEDNSLVIYKKVELTDLKPTIKNLNTKKLEKIMKKIRTGGILDKIYISSDNFIIDGHYKWFSLKSLSSSNDAKFSDNTDVIIIDMPIKKLVNTLHEYKIDFNTEQYDKFSLDAEKMKNAEKSIKSIKVHIQKLEDFHNNLQKVKLV
jgi:hypothetical protein